MKVRHERPMSDMSYQVRAPLSLEIGEGERVVIDRWSLTGISYTGKSKTKPRQGILSIPFQGVDIRFEVKLKSGSDPEWLDFDNLTGRQRETLAVFYRSILSGRMASTDEVITSLDTPVDLVPMGELEEEKVAAVGAKPPRSLRVVLNAFVFGILAFLVFGLLWTAIYDRLSGIRLQHGRIVPSVVEYRLTDDAYVEKNLVNVGDAVQIGDLLVRLENPQRNSASTASQTHVLRVEQGKANVAILHEERPAARQVGLPRLRRDASSTIEKTETIDIVSQVNGTVRELGLIEDYHQPRGSLAAVVEQDNARNVVGWLSERSAQSIYVGQKAHVRVASSTGSRSLNATITNVVAGVDPALPLEFGVVVTLEIDRSDLADNLEVMRPGVPVDIRADRGWKLTPYVMPLRPGWSWWP